MPRSRVTLGLTLAVALVAGCAGAPATASPGPASLPPTARPTAATSARPDDLAPPSLAPTPVPGELAEVALRFTACDIDCCENPGLTVLNDGRVIRRGMGGMTQRRLTPAGMRDLREAVEGTGLFTRDASFDPTLNPGRQPMGFGPMSYGFDVGFGGAPVHIGSVSPGPFQANNTQEPGVWTIPPEVLVLDALATKLDALESWLPADAWAGPAEAFVADRYLLIVTTERNQRDLPPWPDVDTVDWPFPRSIEVVGEPYVRQDISEGDSRCSVVSSQELEAMATAEAAGPDGRMRGIGFPYQSLGYILKRAHGTVDVTTKMVLPYQEPTCEAAGRW